MITNTVYNKTFEGENFHGSSTIFIYVGKTFAVNAPPQSYLKIKQWFNSKTFAFCKNPQKLRKFSPWNVLSYTVQGTASYICT